MADSEDKRKFAGFLDKLRGTRPALRSEVSASEVLHRLADIESDAAEYYDGLAKYTDLPWVREFALRLAKGERLHRDKFLELAGQVEADGAINSLDAPLSEEIIQLLSERVTLPRDGVEKTAIYIGEKDAIELAILTERRTVKLMTQLRGHVPEGQRGYLDRVLKEEEQHQSSLEGLHQQHFGDK